MRAEYKNPNGHGHGHDKCPCCGAMLLFPLDAKANDELVREWGDDLLLEGRSVYYVQQLMYRYETYIKPVLGLIPARAIDKMPAFPSLKVIEREKAWLSTDSQAEVLGAILPCYRLMATIYFATGARPSEIAAMKVKDIEDGGVWIRRAFDESGALKETKTGSVVLRVFDPALGQGALQLSLRRPAPRHRNVPVASYRVMGFQKGGHIAARIHIFPQDCGDDETSFLGLPHDNMYQGTAQGGINGRSHVRRGVDRGT